MSFLTLKLAEALGLKNGVSIALGNIASVYMEQALALASHPLRQEKYKTAEAHLLRALSLDKEIGAQNEEWHHEEYITKLYERTGRPKEALEHYKRAMALKDSLFNEEKNRELTRKEMNYEFEKREALAKAEQDKKDAITRIVIYSVSGGFLLALLMAVLIFRGYRQKQKANKVISMQKKQVEEKQKEILDSIYYARRIQKALLPTEPYINNSLKKRFEK
jgi:tetratricopeptide (TPR) repeat protein